MGPVGSVLFAAGRGVRLRPLTDWIPKAAVPILDVPLGAFALLRLLRAAPPVVVNVSHLGEQVKTSLESFLPTPALVEFLNEGASPPGSGGTLADLAARVTDRVVTHNSDILSDLDLDELLTTHRELVSSATLAVAEVSEGADLEVTSRRVARFVNRKLEPDVGGARFIGVAVLEREVLELIPDDRPVDLAGALLVPLAAEGKLAVHVHNGYWIDVGTPERYLQASLDALNKKVGLLIAPPGRVLPVAGGLAYVGQGARVEDSQLGPGAMVLAGATVAPGTRIERAVVWPNTEVEGDTELRDCIWTTQGRLDV